VLEAVKCAVSVKKKDPNRLIKNRLSAARSRAKARRRCATMTVGLETLQEMLNSGKLVSVDGALLPDPVTDAFEILRDGTVGRGEAMESSEFEVDREEVECMRRGLLAAEMRVLELEEKIAQYETMDEFFDQGVASETYSEASETYSEAIDASVQCGFDV
jgi:hypothetical protein